MALGGMEFYEKEYKRHLEAAEAAMDKLLVATMTGHGALATKGSRRRPAVLSKHETKA
jgi:hypothetical protein